MTQPKKNSILAAWGMAALMVGVLQILNSVPLLGRALAYMAPKNLVHFGTTSLPAMGLAFGLYSLAFYAHYFLENRNRKENNKKNTSIMAVITTLFSLVGTGLVFRYSKYIKYLAGLIIGVTGSAALGTAVYLLWTLGMPAALGGLHYYLSTNDSSASRKSDYNWIDTVYFSFSLSIAAALGWSLEWEGVWNKSSFVASDSFIGRAIAVVAPSATRNPEASVSLVYGQAYTALTWAYCGLRGLACSNIRSTNTNTRINLSYY